MGAVPYFAALATFVLVSVAAIWALVAAIGLAVELTSGRRKVRADTVEPVALSEPGRYVRIERVRE